MAEIGEGTEPYGTEPPKGVPEAERVDLYRNLVAEHRRDLSLVTAGEQVQEIPPLLSGREPLQVKEMEPWAAAFDQQYGVKMLGDAERERFRVFSGGDGKLYGTNGSALDTSGAWSEHRGSGYAVFVMDSQGNMYAAPEHEFRSFHHSSFLQGEPVAGAGEIKVSNGNIEAITSTSGHYRPGPEYLAQVVAELERQKVDVSAITDATGQSEGKTG
jgi:hypothetical protein